MNVTVGLRYFQKVCITMWTKSALLHSGCLVYSSYGESFNYTFCYTDDVLLLNDWNILSNRNWQNGHSKYENKDMIISETAIH